MIVAKLSHGVCWCNWPLTQKVAEGRSAKLLNRFWRNHPRADFNGSTLLMTLL
jgi:hypothetical protein